MLGKIHDDCYLDTDCSDAVNYSYCGYGDVCKCFPGYMISEDNSTCTRRTVGSPCRSNGDCSAVIGNSECDVKNTGNCKCLLGYLSAEENSTCYIRNVTSPCDVDEDCSAAMTHSECDDVTNMCLCTYWYMPNDNDTDCIIRPTLEPYLPVDRLHPGPCDELCNNDTTTHCVRDMGVNQCRCIGGFKRLYNNEPCQRASGYAIQLNITWFAGHFELERLYFTSRLRITAEYRALTTRVVYDGLDQMFINSTLGPSYLGSKILQLSDASPGIYASCALYFYRNSSVDLAEVQNTVWHYMNSSAGEIGTSRYYVDYVSSFDGAVNDSLEIDDLNECARYKVPLHDCSVNASCFNTNGYFGCVCRPGFKNIINPDDPLFGRACQKLPRQTRAYLRLRRKKRRCANGTCSTQWNLVIAVMSVIFTLLGAMLIIEIVWRIKHDMPSRRRKAAMKRRMRSRRTRQKSVKKTVSFSPAVTQFADHNGTTAEDDDKAELVVDDGSSKGEVNLAMTNDDAG